MFHMHGGHRCGPRSGAGHWQRGPFSAEWRMDWSDARGPRGRRRMFDGGELRLVLLRLIADAPRHGYELIKAIEDMTGGGYAPSPGVVYPSLTMLGEMGLIEEQASEGAKKRYAATLEGTAHLTEHAEQAAALIARLQAMGEERNRPDGAPIRRAMGNLRHALQDRLARGGFSEDTLHDIAGLIDELAQKIERLR